MPNCLNCGTTLLVASISHQRKYCSIQCQQAYQNTKKLENWLATGKQWVGVKAYVMDAQKNLCAICDMLNTWQGKPLVFVLDHIDGDSTNNWRSNLRCICPHCDSQLPTFKNRNKGKGRHSRRERYNNGQSY